MCTKLESNGEQILSFLYGGREMLAVCGLTLSGGIWLTYHARVCSISLLGRGIIFILLFTHLYI